MSKTLQKWIDKNPGIVDEWHTEYDGYGEPGNDHLKSYWIYLKQPYISWDSETGTIHVKSVKEAIELLNSVEVGVVIDGHVVPKRFAQ